MFERFTLEARGAVERAVAEAHRTTAGEVRPQHLLGAVLAEETAVAATVVVALGSSPARLRATLDQVRRQYVDGLDADDSEALAAIGIDLDEVVRRIDRNLGGATAGATRRGPARRLPLSRDSKRALQLALREAASLHHGYLGTEHLLLGLARTGDRVVTDTLAACGLDHAALRGAVAEAARRAG